jgi:hypothetical protein
MIAISRRRNGLAILVRLLCRILSDRLSYKARNGKSLETEKQSLGAGSIQRALSTCVGYKSVLSYAGEYEQQWLLA